MSKWNGCCAESYSTVRWLKRKPMTFLVIAIASCTWSPCEFIWGTQSMFLCLIIFSYNISPMFIRKADCMFQRARVLTTLHISTKYRWPLNQLFSNSESSSILLSFSHSCWYHSPTPGSTHQAMPKPFSSNSPFPRSAVHWTPFLIMPSFHVFANIAGFHIVYGCSGKFQGQSESISLTHLLEWSVDLVSLVLGTGVCQVCLGLRVGFDCLKIHTYTHAHT